MLKRILPTIVLVLALIACGETAPKGDGPIDITSGNNSTDVGDNSDAANNAADTTFEPDLIMEDGGPVFVNLSASPSTITEGGTINIVAQLTDPDGFDDIGGGRLLDAEGNVFGNFNGSGGSYDLTLAWNQINDIDPISFETSVTTGFIAEFFDAGGLKSQMSVSVEFNCGGDPACRGACQESLCDDTCLTGFTDVENCGQCGNTCGDDQSCVEQACVDSDGNYQQLCNNEQDCNFASVNGTFCESFFGGDTRCQTQCEDDDDCPNGICNLGVCMVDCSTNANVCVGDLECKDIEGRTVCFQPNF